MLWKIIGLVVGVLVLLLIGFALGVIYRKKVSEREISSAEDEAKRIINDGIKTAENKKREALLEAKEETHRLRSECDREIKERRNEVQKQERRLQQKEENLDRKTDSLEKKTENSSTDQISALGMSASFFFRSTSGTHFISWAATFRVTSSFMSMDLNRPARVSQLKRTPLNGISSRGYSAMATLMLEMGMAVRTRKSTPSRWTMLSSVMSIREKFHRTSPNMMITPRISMSNHAPLSHAYMPSGSKWKAWIPLSKGKSSSQIFLAEYRRIRRGCSWYIPVASLHISADACAAKDLHSVVIAQEKQSQLASIHKEDHEIEAGMPCKWGSDNRGVLHS